MNDQTPTHASSLRNLRITAVDRPELRAVFVAGDNGLTMRWISTPRTSSRYAPPGPTQEADSTSPHRNAA